jgi:hypothetical protein
MKTEDFGNGHEIVSDSLSLMNEIEFENYLRKSIRDFISNNKSKKVQTFLSYLNSLYLDIMIDNDFLNEEKNLAKKGRLIIMEYINNFIKGVYERT